MKTGHSLESPLIPVWINHTTYVTSVLLADVKGGRGDMIQSEKPKLFGGGWDTKRFFSTCESFTFSMYRTFINQEVGRVMLSATGCVS